MHSSKKIFVLSPSLTKLGQIAVQVSNLTKLGLEKKYSFSRTPYLKNGDFSNLF